MIIADTGFWLALGQQKDRYHQAAKLALSEIKRPLITTWPILTETCHLLQKRVGVSASIKLMNSLEAQAFHVFELGAQHSKRLVELMSQYKDLPMDLADASLVVLAEQLGHGEILTSDRRDFHVYRWNHNKPFKNLMLP